MSFLSTSFDFITSNSPSSLSSPRLKESKRNDLEDTFFVFEESTEEELSQEKIDTLSTKMLYFHPSSMSEEKQYWILGIIQTSIGNFQSYHLDDNITMLKFTKSKMALKKVVNVYIALSSSFYVPDDVLKTHVEKLINTFIFFNGPISNIQKRFKERSDYLNYMNRSFNEIRILASNYNSNPNYVFEPIPYLQLPLKSNSIFILMTQFLDKLKEFKGLMGSTIFYDGSVITNQLPLDIVSCLLFRYHVKGLLKKEKRFGKPASLSMTSNSSFSINTIPKPRYAEMSSSDLSDDLHSTGDDLLTDDDEDDDPYMNVEPMDLEFNSTRRNLMKKLDSFPVFLTISQLKKFGIDGLDCLNYKNDILFKVENDILIPQMLDSGMFFSTVILNFDRISISYIIDLKSLEDKKKIEELQSQIILKMTQFDCQVKSAFLSRESSKYVTRGNNIKMLKQQGISSSALIYDHSTKQATGYFNQKSPFIRHTSLIHEQFNSNPNVQKIILRNHTGYFHSTKLHGTEFYYHHPFTKKQNFIEISNIELLERTILI
eukprot:gene4690-8262_t